jgi:hypothetical protein
VGKAVVYEDRMRDGDALIWNIERDPVLCSTITGLSLLDRAQHRARFLDRTERAPPMEGRLSPMGFARIVAIGRNQTLPASACYACLLLRWL